MTKNLQNKFDYKFEIFKSIFNSFFLVNRFSSLLFFIITSSFLNSQGNIAIQDFEVAPATPTLTYATASGGALVSGSSVAADRPALSPFYSSATRGWGLSNGTSVITFANVSSIGGCNTKYFEFKLAAFSIGSSANGMEPGDIVTAEVSLDGGTTWSREVTVNGAAANNSYWSFAATGTASVVYDGNNVPTAFSAASAGNNAAGHSTVRIAIADATTEARLRITLLSNAAAERWVIDDVKLYGTCPLGCVATTEPTTETSAVTVSEGCTSAQLNFTNGDGIYRMVVMSTNCTITDPLDLTNYNSNSTYGSGNTTGANDYVVYNGSASTTIVQGLTAGTSYCFKIYEYNVSSVNCDENYLIPTFSTNFTTIATCAEPQIRSILVNACTVAEGTDEVVIITNGNSALDVDDIQIDFPSGGSFCNSGCGTQTFVNNAAYVTSLNTLAGCALFQYATTIPANASVVVFTGSTPTMTFNYSSECPGGGPYYVLFANNTNATGRFSNGTSPVSDRTLTVSFGGSTDAVTYSADGALVGANGDYVSFDNAGTPTYANTAACSTPIILPIELSLFEITCDNPNKTINWSTNSERNNSYFTIEESDDALIFNPIAKIFGNGTTTIEHNYSFDLINEVQNKYYRLKQTDFSGKSSFSETIFSSCFNPNEITIYPNPNNGIFTILGIEKESLIRIHDELGREIFIDYNTNKEFNINLSDKANGIYFVTIQSELKKEIIKINLVH